MNAPFVRVVCSAGDLVTCTVHCTAQHMTSHSGTGTLFIQLGNGLSRLPSVMKSLLVGRVGCLLSVMFGRVSLDKANLFMD